MTDKKPAYQFSPRPEAHAMMCWRELFDPVKRAVYGVLLRIEGAEAARRVGPGASREFGSCFLVYGARGTGKTTVLLSAREAVRRPEEDQGYQGFFHADANARDPLEEEARACALRLKEDQHIVWLDPLDLEPLQPTANLLTTLLTRVRKALDARGDGRESTRSSSIFEESAADARQQFTDLINDATLMWEEIDEPDTRNTAIRQRAAAEIYTDFRARFIRAMDALSQKLALRQSHDQGCAIILPIDNIDRSPEHLKDIVKLAQMVAHPCLWLVMAGDRVEVEGFLERAYWKELILGGVGADARGKAGQTGEDESLGMARRQAHAVGQKVWPPSHRIEVDAVGPEETLCFKPPGEAGAARTIRELLKAVEVPCFISDKSGAHSFEFIDLFENAVTASSGKDSPDPRTLAGRHALCLSARDVLDLWQLANGVAADPNSDGAVMIARTMLRSAAAASNLSSRMVQHLQDETIQRDAKGRTLLNLARTNIEAWGLLSVASTTTEPAESDLPDGLAIRSSLQVRRSREMRLYMTFNDLKLTELAAGWLAILHDVLVFVPELAVLGKARIKVRLVEASHEIVAVVDGVRLCGRAVRPWPAPDFSTFDAHENFWRHWGSFQAEELAACATEGCPGHACATLQLRAWLRCALRVFEDCGPPRRRATLANNERGAFDRVFDEAAGLYSKIKDEGRLELEARTHFESIALCEWLESQLPLLLTRLYAPVDGDGVAEPSSCRKSLMQWVTQHRDGALVAHWRKNRVFLWAGLDAELNRMFAAPEPEPSVAQQAPPKVKDLSAAQREALQRWAYGELGRALA